MSDVRYKYLVPKQIKVGKIWERKEIEKNKTEETFTNNEKFQFR